MILDIIYIYIIVPTIQSLSIDWFIDNMIQSMNSTGNFCCNHRLWCPFPLKNQWNQSTASNTMYQGPKNKNIWCPKNLRLLSDSASSHPSNQSNHPKKSRKPQNTTGQRIWWLILKRTKILVFFLGQMDPCPNQTSFDTESDSKFHGRYWL